MANCARERAQAKYDNGTTAPPGHGGFVAGEIVAVGCTAYSLD
jgi:hypothetical protein